ncbi:hypothetical protein T06_4385 [Trichinella sp. T6]|nr:hypothetical protein T06_4385 [Trichinella sp. T6]
MTEKAPSCPATCWPHLMFASGRRRIMRSSENSYLMTLVGRCCG